MSIAEHIKSSLQLPTFVVNGYLEDLTDADLLVRPAEKSNHINWQLGHLIQSEQFHTSQVCPDVAPELPAGFKERYTKETVSSDNPADFLSKAELVELMHKQREATLNALSKFSDEELMQPAPESVSYLGPTVGCVFAGEATHWMMHAGQWSVIRRIIGKQPLF
ncbi:DinB superfamily protein [Gimesia maris]|uniref:DinB family protein n=1 Tax=Gimesia maris TaxID=122 RepID=UPI00118AE6EA|nr:DinB family protein [Gimesia maris]QDU16934.1 DinB superfamily protein [Gimesia maris]